MSSKKQNDRFFEKLTNLKQNQYDQFFSKYYGIFRSVIEKYSDRTHFLYELLQNADDTGAKEVEFLLTTRGLWLKHNGKERFTISDYDDTTSPLGHINSITSIGDSNKVIHSENQFNHNHMTAEDIFNGNLNIDDPTVRLANQDIHQSDQEAKLMDEEELAKEFRQNKIGKFGVGFKSVFTYTNMPFIYDDYCFYIKSFIVPVQFDPQKFPPKLQRTKHETLFYFPFKIDIIDAFDQIKTALSQLYYPLMHIFNLNKITCYLEDPNDNNKKIEFVHYKKNISDESYITANPTITSTQRQLSNQTQKNNDSMQKELFMTYKKKVDIDQNIKSQVISISFPYTEDKGQKYLSYHKKYQSFCFFSIEDSINLGFMIHAPFLLVESRAGFLLNDPKGFNQKLILELSKLIEEALLDLAKQQLIDDHIIDIVFCDPNVQKTSLYTFYQPIFNQILKTFQQNRILPGRTEILANGEKVQKYYWKSQAYWPSDPDIVELFNDQQLSDLYSLHQQIGFTFVSKTSKYIEMTNKPLNHYMLQLCQDKINPEHLAKKINLAFMNKYSHSVTWLIQFYLYVQKHKLFKDQLIKNNTLFVPNQNLQMICITKNGVLSPNMKIYFPFNQNKSAYSHIVVDTIHPKIALECKAFFTEIGIPSVNHEVKLLFDLRDFENNCEIYFKNNLPIYFDFLKTIIQYLNIPNTNASILTEIYDRFKEINFIKSAINQQLMVAKDIYWPSDLLDEYIDALQVSAKTVDIQFYSQNFTKNELKLFQQFLQNLGVKNLVKIRINHVSITDNHQYDKLKKQFSLTHLESAHANKLGEYIEEPFLDLLDLSKKNIFTLDFAQVLIAILNDHLQIQEDVFKSKIKYFPKRRPEGVYETFDGTFVDQLRNKKWLLDINSKFKSPVEISNDLSMLHSSIKIPKRVESLLFSSQSLNTPEDIFKNLIKEYGEQVLNEFQSFLKRKKGNAQSTLSQDQNKETETKKERDQNSKQIPKIDQVMIGDITKDRAYQNLECLQEIEARIQQEYDHMQRLTELTNILIDPIEKYKYIWFLSLLEKEILLTEKQKKSKSKKIKLNFSKIELDQANVLILSKPAFDYLDPSLEEATDLRLILEYDSPKKKERLIINVNVDVAQVEENRIKVRIKDLQKLKEIKDYQRVKARLDITKVDFLKEKLLSSFQSLLHENQKIHEQFDLKQHLTENITFIFGPPGTGKTTRLSQDIHQLMSKNEKKKILVLTPTNQAADVLSERIINQNIVAKNWLLRLGNSISDTLLKNSVVIDNTYDIKQKYPFDLSLVTTIARFPYENFRPGTKRAIELKNLEWDYVIFDEASMIPLVDLIYVIYYLTESSRKRNHAIKFIIAGDPFQIPPISLVKEIQDENIYQMVGLNSFALPNTQPHSYEIIKLLKQYRAVPVIGELFSQYRYDGQIEHHKNQNSFIKFHAKNFESPFSNVQIIHFDVNNKPIYRVRTLNASPYQIYSALFTVEFALFLYSEIQRQNLGLKIGIICPYAAQAKMIDKTISIYRTDIVVGTVHRFQGDECDIILAVFNPPKVIHSKIFLNQKNILNVAISRAKQYLFIIRPNEDLKDAEKLEELNHIESLIPEDQKQSFDANWIEKRLWKSENYIENSTFVSTHQSVNVYSHLMNKYEVRAEEYSLDVQINLNLDLDQRSQTKTIELDQVAIYDHFDDDDDDDLE